MAISFAQQDQVTCPTCNKTISIDIWMIVDPVERPDLREQVEQDTIHDVKCPECEKFVLSADAPLMVRLPHHKRIIVCTAGKSNARQDRQHVAMLMKILKNRAPEAIDGFKLVGVPRQGISTILQNCMEPMSDGSYPELEPVIKAFMELREELEQMQLPSDIQQLSQLEPPKDE